MRITGELGTTLTMAQEILEQKLKMKGKMRKTTLKTLLNKNNVI